MSIIRNEVKVRTRTNSRGVSGGLLLALLALIVAPWYALASEEDKPAAEAIESVESESVEEENEAAVLADEAAQAAATPAAGQPATKKEISLTKIDPLLTPVSNFTGDFGQRSTLFGDLGGARQRLYDRGVMFDVGLTQVGQWVTSGGAEEVGRYNGLLDYGVSFDTGKLDLWPAGLLVANAQTSFGTPISTEVGNIVPVNYTALLPEFFTASTVLMEYYWAQALPGKMVLKAGRLNATNFLDKNRFANDPRNQFLNTQFAASYPGGPMTEWVSARIPSASPPSWPTRSSSAA